MTLMNLVYIFIFSSNYYESGLDNAISLASSMTHYDFQSKSAMYEQCFEQRCLRMHTTNPIFLFDMEKPEYPFNFDMLYEELCIISLCRVSLCISRALPFNHQSFC